MKSPICGEEILPKEINKEIQPFIVLLMSKVEELNYRVRDVTKESLISVFKHNQRPDEGKLIDQCMDVVTKGPAPQKAAERIILGRLELVLMVFQQLPVRARPSWDWQKVLQQLIVPSLLSQHSNARWMAQQNIAIMYQIYGPQVKDILLQQCQQLDVRSNISDGVLQRLTEIDQNGANFNDNSQQQPYGNEGTEEIKEMPAGRLTQIPEIDENEGV